MCTRLKTKAKIVRAEKYNHRKFALFSARTIEGKESLRNAGYLVFDGADIEDY